MQSECPSSPARTQAFVDRESSGSLPSRMLTGLPVYQMESPIYVGKGRPDNLDTNTGSLSVISPERSPSPLSRQSFLERCTENSPVRRRRRTMCSRMTPQSLEHGLNWESNQSYDHQEPIGTEFGTAQRLESWNPFLLQSEYKVTLTYDASGAILRNLLRWNVHVTYFGALQELVKADEHGLKPAWMLILRAPLPNSGTVTTIPDMVKLINQLLSMNFEEKSEFHTYSGGWTVTQYVWKPKEVEWFWLPRLSGSRPICTQEIGIRGWIRQQPRLL